MRFRLYAAGIHFLLSVLVLSVVTATVLLVWYSFPFYRIEGVWDVGRYVLLVDVVLGPVMTLILARQGKPGLKLDLTIVAAVQIGALAYGVGALYTQRPVAMAFTHDRFVAVLASQISSDQIPAGVVEDAGQIGPVPVYVLPPKDDAERRLISHEYLTGEAPDLPYRLERYRHFNRHFDEIVSHAVDPKPLAKRSEPEYQRLAAYLERNRGRLDSLAFVPLQGSNHYIMAVLDRSSRSIIDYILVDPWPL